MTGTRVIVHAYSSSCESRVLVEAALRDTDTAIRVEVVNDRVQTLDMPVPGPGILGGEMHRVEPTLSSWDRFVAAVDSAIYRLGFRR